MKFRSIFTDLFVALASALPAFVVVIGLLYGNRYLLWGGLVGLTVLYGIAIVYAGYLGVSIPWEIVRRWREYPAPKKWFHGAIGVVLVLGLFAVCGVAAWLVLIE